MKLRFPLVLIALLSLVAALWSSEDYEIFSLNDKVRKDLGPDTTFYSWLGLPKGPKSTKEEIVKAYRKLSRKNHPDKLRGKSYKHKKKVEERFQRLSAVGNILKNESLKKRYDYFYRNGFPTLKGTDYLYSRFRPGIFVTLFVVFVVVSSFQYISLRISRRQDFKRISTIVDDIRLQAWGNSLVPPLDGLARKVVSPNGKEFLVSAVGDVSLVDRDEDGNEFLSPLDANAIDVNPGFKESYFYLFPCYLWNSTLGRLTGYIINTKSTYVNTKSKQTLSDSVEHGKKKKKKKKASQKGTKVELPNGKVIHSRKKQ